MTRPPGSRNRRRRGRSRPDDAVRPEKERQSVQEVQPDLPVEQIEPDLAPQRLPNTQPVSAGERDGERGRGGPRPQQAEARPGRQGDRPGAGDVRPGPGRNRRRGQRRSPVMPVHGEVLKANAPVTGVEEPRATHTLEAISANGEPVFGCPMLSRSKIELPFASGRAVPRCALGWSLHSESEAAYCLATPDHVLCWKVHPERLDEIRATIEAAAAD